MKPHYFYDLLNNPATRHGRRFTFLIVIVGLGVVSVPTGLIASGLQQARTKERLTVNHKNNENLRS